MSTETTDSTGIPHNIKPSQYGTTMTRVNATAKIKSPIIRSQAPKGKGGDTNIQAIAQNTVVVVVNSHYRYCGYHEG